MRAVGNKVVFMVVREEGFTVQYVVAAVKEGLVSSQMVRFVKGLSKESFVDLEGEVTVPDKPILGASQQIFMQFLESEEFIGIYSPKLIAGSSEGGSAVFELQYNEDKSAYLAQSPQLHKQMAICGDFPRVFEVGPVFRAENSDTHRYLCEFTGLDVEMVIKEHYSEYLRETLRLPFEEGIRMLQEAGLEVDPMGDLNTVAERKLGQLVEKKYDTEFYILHRYPLAVRPFYTMPCYDRPEEYSNSFDVFIRGEEIISGGQRIHVPELLASRAKAAGIDVSTISTYIDAFRYGAPPHGGFGVGLERVVMLFCNLGNIRKTSMFPHVPS